MKKVENELQQEFSRKLDALMEFTLQLQQDSHGLFISFERRP
jgi:hypothetical protein